MEMKDLKQLFDQCTIKKLAEYLGVHIVTVYGWEKIPKKYAKRVVEFIEIQNENARMFCDDLLSLKY